MTEATARTELPEGPWNYDYHGDWSTYAMGLEGTAISLRPSTLSKNG